MHHSKKGSVDFARWRKELRAKKEKKEKRNNNKI